MSGSTSLRVAVVAYTEYPFDMRIRREVETLVDEGLEVDVIACSSSPPPAPMKLGGGALHELPILIRRGGKARYVYQYCSFFILSSALLLWLHARKRYSLVHVHSLPDFQVFCALPPKLFGVPVILDLHESFPEILAARFNMDNGSLLVRLAGSLEQMSTRFANRVIAANNGIQAAVGGRGTPESRTSVIYNIGDEAPEPINGDQLREEIGIPRGALIVHAGGINPERDLETVISALAMLPERFDVSLVVAGAGDRAYIESLRQLALERNCGDRVHFVGRLPLKRAKALMSLATLGLVSLERNPLTELAWPTRIVEFANLGKPLLVSDLKFLHSILGSTARYYEPGDAADLAAQIVALLDSPAESAASAALAGQLCRRFGSDAMRQSLLEVYHGLLY